MISTKLFSTLVGCLLLSCASCASTTDDPEIVDVGEYSVQVDYEVSAAATKLAPDLAPGRLNDESLTSSRRYVSDVTSAPDLEIHYSKKFDADDDVESYLGVDCRVTMNCGSGICIGTGIYECVVAACGQAWGYCSVK